MFFLNLYSKIMEINSVPVDGLSNAGVQNKNNAYHNINNVQNHGIFE
jgi:hypothetical protein